MKLTEKDISYRVDDGMVNYARAVTKYNDRPFVLTEKLGWVKTFPTVWTNYIFFADFSTGNIDEEISGVISKMKSGELPNFWLVGSKSKPIDLCERLEKHSLIKQTDLAGMAFDLTQMNIDIAIPENLVIRAVDSDSDLQVWVDFVSAVLWNGGTFEASLFEKYIHDPNFRFYHAFLNGELVASSMVEIANETASLDMIATLEQYRNIGIGTVMTKFPLLYARDRGCEIAVLQASHEGESLYRKVGFREYFRYSGYIYQ